MPTESNVPGPNVVSVTPMRRALAGAAVVALIVAFAASMAFGRTGDDTSDADTSMSIHRQARPSSTDATLPQPQATSTAGPLPLPYTDPNAKIQVFDHSTAQLVTFTEKEWHEAALPYMPHPAGSLVASVYLENGVVKPQYHERTVTVEQGPDGTTEIGATGREVPFDEAWARVEEEWRTLPPVPGLQRP